MRKIAVSLCVIVTAAVFGSELVVSNRLASGDVFELHRFTETNFFDVDASAWLLDTNGPSRFVYVGYLNQGLTEAGFPVWTNKTVAGYFGTNSQFAKLTLLAVESATNKILLCFKHGQTMFGEVVNLKGKKVIGPRTQTLLRRDSPVGRTLTNAVFTETDKDSPHLVVKDSWGAEFTWNVTNNTFEFLACKTNAPENRAFGWPEIHLHPPERWVWNSNRWNVVK